MTRNDKQKAFSILAYRLMEQQAQVAAIDPRLVEYFDGMVREPEMHNGYEMLCAVKFLRLLRTYDFDLKKVRQVIRLREGEWQHNGRTWQYVRGGIACPGTTGATIYRWEPFQVFVLASVFGFKAWIDTKKDVYPEMPMLPTERMTEDGRVEDQRRLCTDFTFYAPRKTDKTGLSAFIQIVFFLLEDNNAEAYCCANASDQAKLLYRRTKMMLSQLDDGHRFRMTETVCDWRNAFKSVRDSSIRPLSAGGKTKDGMFAQLCCADEFGSAPYVNGKSDMKMLVDVVQSSMGPRREPLTFTTTTAGRITSGPFIEKLDMLHNLLLRELELDETNAADISFDRILCVLFEPDDWEKTDEEHLLTDRNVRRKINPMLGKIVQHQFYEDAVAKARIEGDLGEVVSKLFNVYQSAMAKPWIKGDRIRPLQVDKRITDCRYEDGWNVFVGMDFSHGDDLFAVTYLGVNYQTQSLKGRFFADCEVWVLEATMNESPNRAFYEQLAKDGWLHICPGEVWDSMLAMTKLAEKHQAGINLVMFGYDPAQSVQPINNLKAWLQSLGIDGQSVINMVVPVGQSAMVQNPRVSEIEDLVKSPEGLIEFSNNPIWPWCFGNCFVELNSSDLRRIIKAAPQNKIDPVAALEDALYCFDLSEGRIER